MPSGFEKLVAETKKNITEISPQDAAAKLREVFSLESAGPTYEGRELVQQIQGQLTRLACATNLQSSAFDAATIQSLRRASLLTDDRYLWHRPTMAALRALKKIDARFFSPPSRSRPPKGEGGGGGGGGGEWRGAQALRNNVGKVIPRFAHTFLRKVPYLFSTSLLG